MLGMHSYNYKRFEKSHLAAAALRRFTGPAPGQAAPDFELDSLDRDTVRLSDYRGHKAVVLTFGSVTCPLTAASIGGLNDLYRKYRGDELEFLFVYVRETHPGEAVPAHGSMKEKTRAARLLRDEEDVDIPILVDDLSGAVHRKYSKLPNPTFLINKNGKVAYRMSSTQPDVLESAIEDLRRGPDDAVAQGGENSSTRLTYPMLHAYRAIERGGDSALDDFRFAFGVPGRVAVETSRFALPAVESAGSALTAAGLSILVLAGAIWAGSQLRKRRFRYDPYLYDWGGEDEAVGI